jgi:hypothetical protein
MSGTRDPTPEELADYHERRIAVRDKFETIGWGSRSSAAFDLRMHATLISDTLNGTRVTRSSNDLLERLEAWADAKLVATKQSPAERDDDPVSVQERLHAAAGLPT